MCVACKVRSYNFKSMVIIPPAPLPPPRDQALILATSMTNQGEARTTCWNFLQQLNSEWSCVGCHCYLVDSKIDICDFNLQTNLQIEPPPA